LIYETIIVRYVPHILLGKRIYIILGELLPA